VASPQTTEGCEIIDIDQGESSMARPWEQYLPTDTTASPDGYQPSGGLPSWLPARSIHPLAGFPVPAPPNLTARALRMKGVPEADIAAATGNPETMKQLINQTFGPGFAKSWLSQAPAAPPAMAPPLAGQSRMPEAGQAPLGTPFAASPEDARGGYRGLLDRFSPGVWPGLLNASVGPVPLPARPAPMFVPQAAAAYREPAPGAVSNTSSPLGEAMDGLAQSLAAKWAATKARAMMPEAADHGRSERAKLSPLQMALTPITSYPETYLRMDKDALDQMSYGFDQFWRPDIDQPDLPATGSEFDTVAPHPLPNMLKGAGNIALGALGHVTAPINAAYRTVVGQPIEDLTGIPREYTEFAAQLATPGLGLLGRFGKRFAVPPPMSPRAPSGVTLPGRAATEALPTEPPNPVSATTGIAPAQTGSSNIVPALPGREAAQATPTELAKPVSAASDRALTPTGRTELTPDGRQAPVFEGVMPELATRYPFTGPPTIKFDPETGQFYWAKAYIPEEERLQAHRIAIQKDIDAGNITPEFDPAKRYPADRTQYPLIEDTRNIRAVTASTQAKHDAIARSPAATQRLDDTFQKGLEQRENARNFADIGQFEDACIRELGPEQGRKRFKQIADSIAVTSAGADPEANLLMAHFANYLSVMGKNMPTAAYDIPYPVGSRWGMPNMEQYKKMLMGSSSMQPTGITLANPKRYDYANALLGHTDRAPWPSNGDPTPGHLDFDGGPPIDEQRFRLMDPTRSAPPPGTYGHYKAAVVDRAAAHGVSPTFFGDMLYAGARDHLVKPMIQYINEMLERTHRVTGVPRDRVLRGLIRSNMPMFGIGGIMVGNKPDSDDGDN
jgi:hypothetical protein